MTEESHVRRWQQDQANAGERDIASAGQLISLLWDHKWLILCVTTAVTLAAGLTAWRLPERYEATVVVSPVSDEYGASRLGGLGTVLSQVGGLASLAGISTPGNNMREESIATLQSASLTQSFIQANNLLPILYSSKWDPARRAWKASDPHRVPTLWKACEYFRKQVRTVVENKKSGLVSVTITWTDPTLAAQWANDLVRTANDYLRGKAIRESERNIDYLNEQANKTNILEVKKAIYSLTEAEIRKVMLARGTDEYALRVVDRALVPERPSSPRIVLWLGTGFFGGFLLSAVFVLTRHSLAARP